VPAPTITYYAPAPTVTYASPTVTYASPAVTYSYYPTTVYSAPAGVVTTRTWHGHGIFRPRGTYTQSYYTPYVYVP
jgi:hypothetical protein